MVNLFGADYGRQELMRRVGDLDQIAGLRHYELIEGNQRGVRSIDFRLGNGFNFTVLPGRGMDISGADYAGIPLCWRSPAGEVASWFYEPEGSGWLRAWPGGLLSTCGLTYAGSPTVDENTALGLHGRASNLVARDVSSGALWEDDECTLWAKGTVREVVAIGENVCLQREIRAKLGETRLRIHDRVENLGFAKVPHMIIYHVNIGFPVVDDSSELLAPVASAKPRDRDAEIDADKYNRFSGPIRDFKEKVYYLDLRPVENEYTYAAVVNRQFNHKGIGVYVKYSRDQFDYFVEWKMMGEGAYVVGIEPSNCHVEGRDKMRREGTLKFLAPGEQREYDLEIGVLPSNQEILSLERLIQSGT